MINNTSILFGDLKYTLNELMENRQSPVKVRRSFARFITLSQQLTESMRKEYKSHTNQDWDASLFEWTETTQLFKKLRRTDYHESPVLINVRESQHYLTHVFEDEEGNEYKGYTIAQVEWGMGDPFSEHIPEKMSLLMYDENMQPLEEEEPEIIEYEFILYPRTQEIKKQLERVGIDDVHKLSQECFSTLEKYFEYYNNQLNRNRY